MIWVSLFPASVFPVHPSSFLFSLPAFLFHGLIEYLLQARPCGRWSPCSQEALVSDCHVCQDDQCLSIAPRASRSAKITDLRSLETLEKYTALLFSLTEEVCKVLPRKPVGGGVGIER